MDNNCSCVKSVLSPQKSHASAQGVHYYLQESDQIIPTSFEIDAPTKAMKGK